MAAPRLKGARCFAEVALALCGALTICAATSVAQEVRENPWTPWKFFVGEWTGEGGGEPGKGTGGFSFAFDLEKKVLIRRSHSDYPATQDRPAYSHQDLMVIYAMGTRAIYFDNEGHVIGYTANFSLDQKSLVFVSDPLTSGPRFRLSYAKVNNDTLSVKFEMAAPDKPESFSVYLQGTAHRK